MAAKPLIVYVPPARGGLGAVGRRGLGAVVLSAADLYQLALDAGFPPSTAVTMVAIALRESSGNPSLVNDTRNKPRPPGVGPDYSFGLWQINMVEPGGASRRAMWGLPNNEVLYDPATNARAAYALWNGSDANLNNWTTYTHKLYLASMPIAQAGAAAVEAAKATDSGATVEAFANDEGGSSGVGTLDPSTLALLIGAGLFTAIVLS